ncbi:competence protein ComEC [Phytohabitans suffuscus]|uniref:Competence protein ComEC n=1 Tax=Phytohabitans suffuscus TaxID=624315 RepID=A0A6F8YER2_9ACTN|nr:competence protein ComEC [Phytohabitans suffuscus]
MSAREAGGRLPDLRLAGMALATWLSALAALYVPVRGAVLTAAVVGVAAGAVVAVMRRRPLPHGWVIASVLLGTVCGSAATAARVATRDAEPIAALTREHARVEAELVVRDDPRPVRSLPGRPQTYLVAAHLRGVRPSDGESVRPAAGGGVRPADGGSVPRSDGDGLQPAADAGGVSVRPAAGGGVRAADGRIAVRARVVVLASDPQWRDLLPGQRLTATGRLLPAGRGDLSAALLSATGPPVRHGEPSWAQRAAGVLRAGLQRACGPLPDEPGGLLPGLVVGDTSRLDPAVDDDFRATGMTHLVAVSGANVAIVIGAVLLVARWARAGPWLSAALCGVALAGFVILARPSPSVVRAGAMGAIGLIALAGGRPRAAVPALAAAVTVLVVWDPELAGDAGFALSVLATSGLLLLAPRWRDGLRRAGVPAGAAEALAVPAAAQFACGPVVAGLSGTVSLVAVPANLLAVPAIAPATLLGVGAAVVSPVWPAGAAFAAWLGGWPAWWLVIVARYGARVPSGNLPWPGGVAGALLLGAVSVAFLIAARRRLVRQLAAVVAAAVVIGALPVRLVASGWPPAGWFVAVCSVGQGDAVLVPVGPGQAVVIDAGPEAAAADRCLRRHGVRAVPLLAVTHFHADHIGGLDGVLRGRSVDAVVTTAWPEPAYGRDRVMRAAAGRRVPVEAVTVGWSRRLGQVLVEVVGPPHEMRGTRSDPNNNSQ